MKDSLSVAFQNLLKRHELPTDNLDIGEDADWHTITHVDPRVIVKDIGQAGTWPHTTDAIVMFFLQSEDEPYVVDNGFQKANLVATYCLMHDPAKKLLIDADGQIREAGNYGTPVGWASYHFDLNAAPSKPEKLHKKLKGETVWGIARRLGIDAKDLIEHNDIEDPQNIPDGTVLHLPKPKEIKADRPIVYELLPKPVPMHVSKDDGTRKWSFGNVKTWDDLSPSGFYPKNTNMMIAAVAHVPVGEDTAAYYMDTLSVGDYETTSHVKYTTGFAWSDLEEGYVLPKKKPAPLQAPLATPKPKVAIAQKKLEEKIEEQPATYPNDFKSSYQPLDQPIPCTADLPPGADVLLIRDYGGHRPDKNMPKDWEGYIAGTFEVDGVLYARPLGSVRNLKNIPNWVPNWYGIPVDCLIANKELYTDTSVIRRLTLAERLLWLPLFDTSDKVRKFIKKQKNTKEK